MEKLEKSENRIRIIAGIISLVVALILCIIKFYAYNITHSHAILSDALENITNVVTAIVSLSVVIVSARPADADHPYGHGKAEFFASAFEGGAIMFAGILIVVESTSALINGGELEGIDLGMILVIFAGLINGALGLFLKNIGSRYNSKALVASGTHVMSDCLTSIGIIVGLIIVKFTGLSWLDPATAILLGGLLFYQGGMILKDSGKDLMDAEDKGVTEELAMLLEKHMFTGIIDFHYMRVIRSGRFHHVNIHMDIPDFWTVKFAHEESERFEELVINDYTFDGEIHFHLDPCRQRKCEVCNIKECPVRIQPFCGTKPKLSIQQLTSPTNMARPIHDKTT